MRGVDVPREYWQKVERHWTLQQQPRGGWGYRARRAALTTKTYGSITAAGAATLLVCFDRLHRQRFVRCDADGRSPSLDRGLAWLERHYTARRNPRLGVNWHAYWLFALQRVGLLSGRRSFAGRDWYADGAAELLRSQNADGSFGYAPCTDRTALALLFLAGGRQPVLVNKLRWGGTWNSRPHDAATAVRWVASHYERPLRWQVLDADAPAAAWREAPILYLSGAGPLTLTDAQKARLRRFALAGGLIVSEAACASGDFSLDALALYRELFGPYEPARLSADHPLYTAGPRVRAFQDLRGVSNGVRLLAVHVPSDLSRALQIGPANAGADERDAFRLFQNFFLYVGGRQPEGPRIPPWPQEGPFQPRTTIHIARVRHRGNWDPEPLALPRLAAHMGRRHRIRLEIAAPVRLAELKAAATPIAVLTGTGELPLSDAEADALRAFFADGGKLLVDAAGGDRTFADAARRHIRSLIPHADFGDLPDKVFRTGPAEIEAIRYRPALARVLGPDRHRARLRAWYSAERLVAVFSPDDLTAGLLGYTGYRIRGYHPDAAAAIVTNVLCHFAGVAAADTDGPAAPREPAPAGAEEPAPPSSADE